MNFPTMTNELAERIAQSESDYMHSWLSELHNQHGNAWGVHIETFGSTLAFLVCTASGNTLFNRVLGLRPADEQYIENILAFYHQHDGHCHIDINPHHSSPGLLASLASQGLFQFKFQTVLYGLPTINTPLPTSLAHVTVREVQDHDLITFIDLYTQGFEDYPDITEISKSISVLYRNPGWHLYLAFIDDVPAATAILYIHNGIASLTGAATLPSLRGKGCQTALLHQRITDAAQAGCDLIVGQTGVNTVSQHNMERAGMRIAYTKAKWIEQLP